MTSSASLGPSQRFAVSFAMSKTLPPPIPITTSGLKFLAAPSASFNWVTSGLGRVEAQTSKEAISDNCPRSPLLWNQENDLLPVIRSTRFSRRSRTNLRSAVSAVPHSSRVTGRAEYCSEATSLTRTNGLERLSRKKRGGRRPSKIFSEAPFDNNLRERWPVECP